MEQGILIKKQKCTAVVLAAGSGRRMQSHVAKQYLLLENKPILWYALHTFEKSVLIDEVILVVGKGEIDYCRREIVEKFGFEKVADIIEGGSERYLSVWEALKAIYNKKKVVGKEYGNDSMEADIIFIHDGARPFVTERILQDTYRAACQYDACVTGMPVKDTIKISDTEDFAVQTPNRKMVWQVQTPQVFKGRLIWEAYSRLMEDLEHIKGSGIEITDDAMVVETIKKIPVKLVKGSYENIKITTPEDMRIAQSFLESIV